MTLIEEIVLTQEASEQERAQHLERMAAEACTAGDMIHALGCSAAARKLTLKNNDAEA